VYRLPRLRGLSTTSYPKDRLSKNVSSPRRELILIDETFRSVVRWFFCCGHVYVVSSSSIYPRFAQNLIFVHMVIRCVVDPSVLETVRANNRATTIILYPRTLLVKQKFLISSLKTLSPQEISPWNYIRRNSQN